MDNTTLLIVVIVLILFSVVADGMGGDVGSSPFDRVGR